METLTIDLKEVIFDALKKQREECLEDVIDFPAFDSYTTEEYPGEVRIRVQMYPGEVRIRVQMDIGTEWKQKFLVKMMF